jgi:tetratricopeptide (TPR) repeat protein
MAATLGLVVVGAVGATVIVSEAEKASYRVYDYLCKYGDPDRAIDAAEKALDVPRALLRTRMRIWGYLVEAHRRKQDLDGARKRLREGYEARAKSEHVEERLEALGLLFLAAQLRIETGELKDADRLLRGLRVKIANDPNLARDRAERPEGAWVEFLVQVASVHEEVLFDLGELEVVKTYRRTMADALAPEPEEGAPKWHAWWYGIFQRKFFEDDFPRPICE